LGLTTGWQASHIPSVIEISARPFPEIKWGQSLRLCDAVHVLIIEVAHSSKVASGYTGLAVISPDMTTIFMFPQVGEARHDHGRAPGKKGIQTQIVKIRFNPASRGFHISIFQCGVALLSYVGFFSSCSGNEAYEKTITL
jgi:hypothetical protein